MRIMPFLFICLFLTALVAGQSATYILTGNGCGSPVSYCLSNNPQGGTLGSNHNSNIFSLEVKRSSPAPVPILVMGFELYTQATTPLTINTFIYDADPAGKPGKTLATGTMKIGTGAAWYSTMLAKPIVIPPTAKKFFISYTSVVNTMKFPFLPRTGTATFGVHYWHGPSATTWNGPHSTIKWAWRVICPGGVANVPLIGNSGLPVIAKSMNVTLGNGPATTVALLTLGFNKSQWAGLPLPFDLTNLGATGCSLQNSISMVLATNTNTQGSALLPLAIPNDPTLIGGNFYNQWVVMAPGANNLGVLFTGGGNGMIGK